MSEEPVESFDDNNEFGIDQYEEIRVNPDYFLFMNLAAIEKIFETTGTTPGEIRESYSRYQLQVDRLESKMRALDKLPKNYDSDVKAFLESDEIKNEKDIFIRQTKIATRKESLIQKQIGAMRYLSGVVKA